MIPDKTKIKDKKKFFANTSRGQDVIIIIQGEARQIEFKQPIRGKIGSIIYMNEKHDVIDMI